MKIKYLGIFVLSFSLLFNNLFSGFDGNRDSSGQNFSSQTISHDKLDNYDFSKADLWNVSFKEIIIKNSVFTKADLNSSSFIRTEIINCDMSNVSFGHRAKTLMTLFEYTNFFKAKINGAEFKQTTFKNCIALNCDASANGFGRTVIRESIIDGLNMSESNLKFIIFNKINVMKKFSAVNSDLTSAYFFNVTFGQDCDFTGANFSTAHFKNIIFNDSMKFDGANFQDAVGLTSEQRVFLSAKHAVNVPTDEEIAQREEESKQKNTGLRGFFGAFKPSVEQWYHLEVE